jgi:hypothetical protein
MDLTSPVSFVVTYTGRYGWFWVRFGNLFQRWKIRVIAAPPLYRGFFQSGPQLGTTRNVLRACSLCQCSGASARGGREIVFAPSSSESEESEEEGSDAEMSGEEARDKPLTNAGSAVEQLEAGLKGVSVSKFKSGRCIK